MKCILCLGVNTSVEGITLDKLKVGSNPVEEYLNVCKRYLTVEFRNVQTNNISTEFDSSICPVCFCSVEILYKIYKELQQVQEKLKEFSITFSEILNSRRNKNRSHGASTLDATAVHSDIDGQTVKEEELLVYEEEHESGGSNLEWEADAEESDKNDTPLTNQVLEQSTTGTTTTSNVRIAPSKSKDNDSDSRGRNSILKKKQSKKIVSVKTKSPSIQDQEDSSDSSDDEDESGDVLFGCWKCNEKFKSKAIFDIHSRSHLAETKEFICTLCGKSFETKNSLNRHLQNLHNPSPISLTCEICGKISSCERYHKEHQRTHRARQHKCNICERSFLYLSQLLGHKYERHGMGDKGTVIVEKGIYPCDQCSKCFTNKIQFEDHKRVHTGEKPFKCDQKDCSWEFRTKMQLKIHNIRHHSNEFRFVCPHQNCGKKYKFKLDLKDHLPTHNVQDKVKCNLCERRFNTKRLLSNHVRRIHDKEPMSMVCEICGVPKSSKTKLVLHMRTHTGEKPFQCSFCKRHFTSKGRMTQHRKEKNH